MKDVIGDVRIRPATTHDSSGIASLFTPENSNPYYNDVYFNKPHLVSGDLEKRLKIAVVAVDASEKIVGFAGVENHWLSEFSGSGGKLAEPKKFIVHKNYQRGSGHVTVDNLPVSAALQKRIDETVRADGGYIAYLGTAVCGHTGSQLLTIRNGASLVGFYPNWSREGLSVKGRESFVLGLKYISEKAKSTAFAPKPVYVPKILRGLPELVYSAAGIGPQRTIVAVDELSPEEKTKAFNGATIPVTNEVDMLRNELKRLEEQLEGQLVDGLGRKVDASSAASLPVLPMIAVTITRPSGWYRAGLAIGMGFTGIGVVPLVDSDYLMMAYLPNTPDDASLFFNRQSVDLVEKANPIVNLVGEMYNLQLKRELSQGLPQVFKGV